MILKSLLNGVGGVGSVVAWMTWVKFWCGWRGWRRFLKFWRVSKKWRGWHGSMKFWCRWSWWRGSVKCIYGLFFFVILQVFPSYMYSFLTFLSLYSLCSFHVEIYEDLKLYADLNPA